MEFLSTLPRSIDDTCRPIPRNGRFLTSRTRHGFSEHAPLERGMHEPARVDVTESSCSLALPLLGGGDREHLATWFSAHRRG